MAEPVTETDWLWPSQAARLLATFDDDPGALDAGNALPPLWHWLFFLPRPRQSALGPDGHYQRRDAEAEALPRRMYAGGRFRFHAPLILGERAERRHWEAARSEKTGRSGRLVFAKEQIEIRQNGVLCVSEERDIVYRGIPAETVPLPDELPLAPRAEAMLSRVLLPDEVLLFRISALTFNGHRIHYDAPYAKEVEGYPALVVHGPLTALLLLDLLRGRDRIAGFSFRATAPLFCGQALRLSAMPPEDGKIALLAERCDGAVAMQAEAELA